MTYVIRVIRYLYTNRCGKETLRIFVSISELTVGVHISSIINTHTCHLRLMLLSICELRYPESMDNIHMTRTSKSSTW